MNRNEVFAPQLSFTDFISQNFHDCGKQMKDNVTAKTVTFQVTDSCNLRCSYCYEINKSTRMMSFEVGKKIVDALLDGSKGVGEYLDTEHLEGIILDFIGGEPLLNIKVIDQIVDYFEEQVIARNHHWKNKWMMSITTNGTVFNDEVRKFLEKHKYHTSFSVTIDGNKKLHDSCRLFPDGSGSYELAVRTAKEARAMGYDVGTKLTFAHDNIPFLGDAVKNMLALGFRDIRGNCVFEDVWKDGDAKIYYEQLKNVADYFIDNGLSKDAGFSRFDTNNYQPMPESDDKNWCGGTGLMLAFDPDGIAYPCLRYMESSLGDKAPALRIGNIDDGLCTTEREKQAVKCLNCITRRSQSTTECFYCPLARGCAWCSANNYQCFGTANKRATFNCEMHKAEALANVYYWNKLGIHFDCWIPKEWALKIISEKEYNMLLEISKSTSMSVTEAYEKSKELVKKPVLQKSGC